MLHRFRIASYVAVLVTPLAQATEATQPAAATQAAAPAPTIKYDSAFRGYRPFRAQPLAPWREVNDEAHRIGGHIGILRGASDKPATAHSPQHKK